MSQPTMTIRALLPVDRCDRCNARASVALHFDNGELMFCGHHYTEHHPALVKAGAFICGAVQEDS